MNLIATQNRTRRNVMSPRGRRCGVPFCRPTGGCRSSLAVPTALAILAFVLLSAPLSAQRPRFPSGSATPIQGGVASSTSPVDIPLTNLTPIAPQAPPSTFHGQLYDPYATGANQGGFQPAFPPGTGSLLAAPALATPFIPSSSTIPPSQPGASLFSRIFSRPASTPLSPTLGAPMIQSPVGNSSSIYNTPPGYVPGATYGSPDYGSPGFDSSGYGSPGYGSPGYGVDPYPSSVYPSQSPTSLFPGGMFANGGVWNGGGDGYVASAYRLLQGPRARQTYVHGGNSPNDLGINDTDVSLAFAFPSFCYSSQPLFVVPSFSLHLWDGPQGSTGADLPANSYSAFIDFGWQSDPAQMLGTEFGVRVGVFTDFDTYNSESIRYLGKGLLKFRLSPTTILKGGVYYADRNKIKVVPAFGFVCEPNPFTRIDLFFPEPKFSRYWRTIGTRDFWWYLTGDYGGGSWTIQRTDGTSDSIDINDLRVIAGMEWGLNNYIRAGRRSAFVEAGYVFDREIIYRRSPQDDLKLDESFVIRAGFGY